MNLGAIDIGSNAARVLVMKVEEENGIVEFEKQKLFRYPIRLGFDAFLNGEISEIKSKKLIKMCQVFKGIMELYDVEDYIGFATSAMRDSRNGAELIEKIQKDASIDIEIIDGNKEATILYQTHFENAMQPDRNYIYVDVGGGSTEITIFQQKKIVKSKSFKVGTIRLLNNLVGQMELNEMKTWVKETTGNHYYWGIGSGGNINTLFSKSGNKPSQPLSLPYIKDHIQEFQRYSVKQLMKEYGFKLDRADVIVHALVIYNTVFEAAGVDQIFVPKIGLSDGMIRLLSKRYFN